jgi:hypothetical protein
MMRLLTLILKTLRYSVNVFANNSGNLKACYRGGSSKHRLALGESRKIFLHSRVRQARIGSEMLQSVQATAIAGPLRGH